MSMLYNIHTPNKTFAIQHKDGEEYSDLVSRIASKASLSKDDVTALKEGKDGAGLVYEFEGGRWSLEDDDDLQILFSRLPPSSTPSATFHLTPPHPHAHFSIPASPSKSGNTAASALKDKTRSPVKAKSAKKTSSSPLAQNGDTSPKALQDYSTGKAAAAGTQGRELGKAASTSPKDKKSESISAPSHHFPSSSHNGHPHEVLSDKKPNHVFGRGAPSIRSTASRRSKWGDDDAEPLWEVKKRAFYEFHNNQGVRTVTGKIGDVDNVRMLLQPGHRGVYVSRSFALKNNLVPKGYHMGGAGYTGLKMIGLVSITVAGKTQKHQAMVSEEEHFDVVLGRTWVERMSIKVDPIDPTNLTYMDNGATIPVDIVVLKDDKGNKIHIT